MRKEGSAGEGSRERRHTPTPRQFRCEREQRREPLNGEVSVKRSLPVGALYGRLPCRTHAHRGSAGSPAHMRSRMKSPNMSSRLWLCAVLAVYHGTQSCSGFNIDERFPVIKEGKTKGSFFGFSVALHHQTKGTKKYL